MLAAQLLNLQTPRRVTAVPGALVPDPKYDTRDYDPRLVFDDVLAPPEPSIAIPDAPGVLVDAPLGSCTVSTATGACTTTTAPGVCSIETAPGYAIVDADDD